LPFADIPREIAVEVTTACNLACGICFHAGAVSRHLPLSALIRFLNRCAARAAIMSVSREVNRFYTRICRRPLSPPRIWFSGLTEHQRFVV
jgi:hypothetical protein